MGKLKITGRATHDYAFDVVEISLRFHVYEDSSSSALQKVLEQCEDFLSIMNSEGVSMDCIRIKDDSVEQDYDEDSKLDVCATRELTITIPFDMRLINHIMMVIQDRNYNVDIETEYMLSKIDDIHQSLIKEAIEDSRKKAADIVESIGQKLVGIDSVVITDYFCRSIEREPLKRMSPVNNKKELHFSNQIKAPETTEAETVDVVWIIE